MTPTAPRTLEYFLLRAAERFGMPPSGFEALDYDEQVRLMAYDQVRREEALGLAPSA
jgi:hypothetical protein